MRNAITPPDECTGCALCANVCAHHAIRMEWNTEGFLVPVVNAEVCSNCGACVKACPAQPAHLKKLRAAAPDAAPMAAYGAWHANKETQLRSSSGGIFSALAEQIFAQGGCVFGVIWDNKDTAIYTRAENMDQLAAMRGSKYTQAVPGDVYRQVKAELKKGRHVLFCGTPCQVYALRRYLRKEYENLLLVDILCHGVPSRLLLQAYIREYEKQNKKEINRIQFRDKAGNWQQYHIRKHFTDGSSISHMNREDMFMRIFVGDFALNEACYNCPHARFPRVGDISLGDFWGDLYTLHPDWPIKDGISSILGNTQKGNRRLKDLQSAEQIILRSVPLGQLIQEQTFTYLRQNVALPPQRQAILVQLQQRRLLKLFKRFFTQEKCGPFYLTPNSLLHRIYINIRSLKRKILKLFSKQ